MWEDIKIKSEVTGPGELTFLVKQISDRRFGATPCFVSIGGASLNSPDDPTFAVIAFAARSEKCEKWVSTRSDCARWLYKHGLTSYEADLLLDLAAEAYKNRVPSLNEQERQGLYEEEIEKIVNGILEEVEAGNILSKTQALDRLSATIDQSVYTRDPKFALEALLYNGFDPLTAVQCPMYLHGEGKLHASGKYNKLPGRTKKGKKPT